MNLFIRELKASVKPLLFWCLGLTVFIAAGLGKFSATSSSGQSMNELIASMPKSLQTVLGVGGFDLTTMKGFMGVMFLYTAVLVAVHAAALGAGILSKEERDRTFEFLYVRPVTRMKIFAQKLAASVVNLVVMNLITFLVLTVLAGKLSSEPLTGDITRLTAGLLFIQCIFYSVGLLLSQLLPGGRAAGGLAAAVVLVTFIFSVASDLSDNLGFLKYLTPFKYFDAKALYTNGIEVVYVVLSVVIVGACLAVTAVRHAKKDLRV